MQMARRGIPPLTNGEDVLCLLSTTSEPSVPAAPAMPAEGWQERLREETISAPMPTATAEGRC